MIISASRTQRKASFYFAVLPFAAMLYHLWYSVRALYFSLYWPLSISLDAALMRFHAWSLLQGRWPYRDIETLNLPATHYINALSLLILGNSDLAFRWMDLCWVFALALSCATYLWRYNRLAAGVGFILVLNLTLIATPLGAFQRETLMLLFWMLALCTLDHARLQASKPTAWLLLSGGLATASIFIKPTGAIFCLGLFIYFMVAGGLPARQRGKHSQKMIAGGFSVLLMICIPLMLAGMDTTHLDSYLYYFQGWSRLQTTRPISDLLLHLFTLNPIHTSIPLSAPVSTPFDTGHLTLLHIALLIAFIYIKRKQTKPGPDGLWIILGTGFLHYLIQRKGFAYHVFPLWLGFELVLALILADLWQRLKSPFVNSRRISNRSLWVPLGCLITLLGIGVHRQSIAKDIMAGYLNKQPPHSRVAETINQLSTKYNLNGTSVQNLEIHSMAMPGMIQNGLHLATRYPMDHVLWENSPYSTACRQRFMQSVIKKKPTLFIIHTGSAGDSETWLKHRHSFVELDTYLTRRYRIADSIREINQADYLFLIRKDLDEIKKDRS